MDDPLFEAASSQFSDQQMVDLTLAIVAINGWNRLAVSMRTVPGSYRRPAAREPQAAAGGGMQALVAESAPGAIGSWSEPSGPQCRFSELSLGARFRLDGETLTKAEHELRAGMLQCSNALSDQGSWRLVAEDEPIELTEP